MTKQRDLHYYLQLKAIQNVLSNNDEYFYRKICRWFSKEFSTPIKDVESLPWDYIITHYYESHIETMSKQPLLDFIVDTYFPEIREERSKIDTDFLKNLQENKEKEVKIDFDEILNEDEPKT